MAVRSLPQEVDGGGRFSLDSEGFTPTYLTAYEEGRLEAQVDEALSHLGPSCRVCPRFCRGVDRLSDRHGVCRVGRHARVSSAAPHLGEEDMLRGWRGSGAIFFSRCNLRCVFCQNFEISQVGQGDLMKPRSVARRHASPARRFWSYGARGKPRQGDAQHDRPSVESTWVVERERPATIRRTQGTGQSLVGTLHRSASAHA